MSGDKETPKKTVENEAEDIQEQEVATEEATTIAESDMVGDPMKDATEVSETEALADEQESANHEEPEDESTLVSEEALEEAPETEDAVISEAPPPPPPAPQAVKRGGFVPMVLGGVVCLALGYAGAQFVKPSGWPFPGTNTEELSQKVTELEAQLADLKSATAEISGAQETANATLRSDLEAELTAMDPSAQLAALGEKLGGFEDRMTEIEARPVAEAIVSPEATAAYERQLTQMQDLLNSEIARLETAKEKSIAEETAARIATNKARLQAQVDGGEPFAEVLAEMDTEVPAALSAAAGEGIPSVSSLQEGYATAARAALVAASKAAYDAGEQGWFQTALRTQLGLRSTTPKEGDGADAVLSRAEQSVRDGLFAKAIATLDSLPEAGKAEMQGWIAQAQKRVDVMTALDEFLGQ
ncbi:COG4223 family protein [Celeribacter neptunius]|uniref:Uncharacterized conserved protein n=1 Tax=Celeribacter neptunius TaxID=588602 RepID=A0A1I3SH09_9RHOB|nr:hypothetical protein [Celeribacter neptunius]SFJ57342.1 Uncharacterized conserved protein [Celeribacter neptunius]